MVDKSYGQKRIAKISRADQIHELGNTYAESGKSKSAARNFERAADLYRLAGLGILAIRSYGVAAHHYTLCGKGDDAKHCMDRASAIETLWTSEPQEEGEES